MLKNYLKIAWRNLLKNKAFSIINISGLAIGLACFLLIALYVIDEWSYDKHHVNAPDMYRIDSDIRFGGSDLKLSVCSDPMGATLKKDYPQVKEYTRIYGSGGSKLIKKGNEYISSDAVSHVDSTFFNVFTFPVIAGNTKGALNEPNTVVLSESAAKKYLNSTEVIGKTIEADNQLYKVTAVIKDMPLNGHFRYDMLFSMKNVNYQMGNYLSHNFHTYILLNKGTDPKVFEQNFAQVIDKYIIPQAKEFMNIKSMDEFKKSGNNLSYTLIPLRDIHLHSDRVAELGTNGDIQYVYIFSAVAFFILLIACINFMNLSTARSANRAKEVGIRKVLGTQRATLIKQFLTESVVMVVISMLLALVLTWLALPLFNSIASKTLALQSLLDAKTVALLVALPILVGVLAGSYPAFFLSRFQPVDVLKGNRHMGFKKSNLRSGLVVFQFATSIVLMIGTLVVYQQLNYIRTTKIGFNKEQVLLVSGVNSLKENAGAFKNELLGMPGVQSGTISDYLPVSFSSRSDNTFSRDVVMSTKNSFNMQSWSIDYDYINTLGMELVKGRGFSKDFGTDSSGILINESAAKLLGYENPIGKKIYTTITNGAPGTMITYEILGVVKNFHYESLRQNIGPLSFKLGKEGWIAAFKVNNSDMAGLVKQVEKKWKAMAPSMPFSYRFLDESFDNMYRTEQRMGTVALTFAILAILIACLGLFGLATYMAEQRIKEIGIRKVLGGSVMHITSLLSKDFLVLVLIAALIAFPLAGYMMSQWLQDFAYRINISWWIYLSAGILAMLIALVTVSFQAIRAATANPVKSLRTE